MATPKKIIPVILGPTSSGKTSLAIKLCKEFGGSIVSADSRQIYKKMDIGTGKVPVGDSARGVEIVRADETPAEKWSIDGVDVWGYDLAAPDQYFSGYDYALFALQKLHDLQEQGTQPFLVGGTGFYIDLVTGLVKPSGAAPDFELRKKLENKDLIQLQQQSMSLNPAAYKDIDQNNPVRLIRAIEKELSNKKPPTPLPYSDTTKFVFIGLTASREFLYQRADTWAETIWENGLVQEVQALLDQGYGDSPKMHGFIYKTVVAHLAKEMSAKEALERIKYDLHAYIRRQQTYFKKRNDLIQWFDITQPNFVEKTVQFLGEKLQQNLESTT